MRNDLADLHKSNVRVRIIGERDDLDPEINRLLQEAEELTGHQHRGSRSLSPSTTAPAREITRAARRAAVEVAVAGRLKPEAITAEAALAAISMRPTLPDPDLIIRTSGEQRLSNFLMWPAAYSELVFLPI